jgi:hypothetical protein
MQNEHLAAYFDPVLRTTLRNLGVAPCRSVSELAERLDIALWFEGGVADGEADLPLFAMMVSNETLNGPKMPPSKRTAIAASNIPTP